MSHETLGPREASTSEGLPVAPSLAPSLDGTFSPSGVDRRTVVLSALAVAIALGASLTARILTALIALVTNLAYFGRLGTTSVSPAESHLGVWAALVPVAGGLVVGLMARFGSRAIRGHGIPEAMEQVLFNESRIPKRMTLLKPLSAAVAIGTGGPFGAEGPIIATGGALGSMIGQLLRTTADERKTLLAAGAAAGMAATFGSPVAAVLLAVELLLFEYRPRSIVPVALATATAAAVRIAFVGAAPVFPMPGVAIPGGAAMGVYAMLGAVMGLASVGVTRLVYAIEDWFERLPLHWMWWPALGGVAVGICGLVAPRTLGVGYDNIERLVSGDLAGQALVVLCGVKLVSWAVSLGSGTSGGTLAPLFTVGGGFGAALTAIAAHLAPSAGVDPRIGALVGMAAIFAGASRALLASIVFAFETTRQPLGLLPLLAGCTVAYLVSCLLMRNTIMTEKLARRGRHVPGQLGVDLLESVRVREVMSPAVVTLDAEQSVAEVLAWLASGAPGADHQGFPVLSGGLLVGVVTRRDLTAAAPGAILRDLVARQPVVEGPDRSVREAADRMAREGVGRLAIVRPGDPRQVVGILTRNDLLRARRLRLVG